MLGPYRTASILPCRCKDALDRVKGAIGNAKEPLLESLHDRDSFSSTFPAFLKKIADIVTDWYTPYLLAEIRGADHYEDAMPAASLLAFSEKPYCIEGLGRLLRSNRPLEVLVTIETLGDLVAFAQNGTARNMAIFYLTSSGHQLAMDELESAMILSPYGYPRPIPLSCLPPVPFAAFVSWRSD
jgi:hypothetical protein